MNEDKRIALQNELTPSGAAQIWGLDPVNVNNACIYDYFTKKEHREALGEHLITWDGMVRVFGEPPNTLTMMEFLNELKNRELSMDGLQERVTIMLDRFEFDKEEVELLQWKTEKGEPVEFIVRQLLFKDPRTGQMELKFLVF